MQKTCVECHAPFAINDAQRAFYKKMDVPEPGRCPLCKHQCRFAFRNERNLYSRACSQCGKTIISIYSPDKPYAVYCRDCFFNDTFDPRAYGRDFDFNRPFFDQYNELLQKTPLLALIAGTNCENSDYVNLESDDKNCYMNVGGHFNEDCYYNTFCLYGKNCVDNYWVFRCELLYECADCYQSYQCFYCSHVTGSSNCWFCYDCRNCANCFGCVNLRNAKYVIFNKQYSKEEYERRVAVLTEGHGALEEARRQYKEEKLKHPHRFAFQVNCERVSGNILTNCKEVFNGFEMNKAEHCQYVFLAEEIKDMFEASHFGWGELIYDSIGGGMKCHDLAFVAFCFPAVSFSRYCMFCMNSEYLFGCVSAKKNSYCILNKEYSKDEYIKLQARIIDHMKQTGEWGEFFPPRISPFGYNETIAGVYFPLAKEEALGRGLKWQDNLPNPTGNETMKGDHLPDRIEEADDHLTKEIIACSECGRNYKIIKQELLFYRRNHLPLPRRCSVCRYMIRMKERGLELTLHHRQCVCALKGHGHHTEGIQCQNEFETTYAPERPEKVFCEVCYQREVV